MNAVTDMTLTTGRPTHQSVSTLQLSQLLGTQWPFTATQLDGINGEEPEIDVGLSRLVSLAHMVEHAVLFEIRCLDVQLKDSYLTTGKFTQLVFSSPSVKWRFLELAL